MPTEPQVMDATVMAEIRAQAENDAAEAARIAAEQAPPEEEVEEEEEEDESDPLKDAHDGDGLVSEAPAKPTNLPKGVQKKIDKLTARYKAEQASNKAKDDQIAQLIALARGAPPVAGEVARAPAATVEEGKPSPDDYKTVGEYVEALTDWKAEQAVAKVAKRDEGKKVADAWNAQLEAGRKEFEDFDEAIDSDLPLTPVMQEAIIQSNVGYKVAYHLANNPDETKRIAALSPARQAAEIGKIEASLDVRGKPTKEIRRTSTAPEPISPLGSVAGRATNARKFEDLSLDEVRQQLKR